jgi:hypothetical protein
MNYDDVSRNVEDVSTMNESCEADSRTHMF